MGGYNGLKIEVPSPEVPDSEVSDQLDRLRQQSAELGEVERAAADGDYLTVDVHGSRDGEELDGLVAILGLVKAVCCAGTKRKLLTALFSWLPSMWWM